MPTTIDERVLMIGLIVAVVVFAILNLIETQKATPNTSTLQSYSVLLLVLSGVLFVLALYFWSTTLPFLRCMNASLRETLGEPFVQPVSASEIRIEPSRILQATNGPVGGKSGSPKKGLAQFFTMP